MKKLLEKMIAAAPTAENGEAQCANALNEFFAANGIDSQVDIWDDNHANIIATLPAMGDRPGLLFASHLDVVPPGQAKWNTEPFEPVEKDGKIFGRGSADMKGGIAALASAMTEIAAEKIKLQGQVVFAATAGEETDSCGAKRFVAQNKDTLKPLAGIIIPEPTDFQVVTAHRGMLWLQIETTGKTAHGSMPHLGINAITSMNTLLNKLETHSIPHANHSLGECSMSINEIHGGEATNVIPDHCLIRIDIRTLPTQQNENIVQSFQQILDELKGTVKDFDAKISVIRSVEALETDNDSDFVKAFCDSVRIEKTTAVGFTTDAPFFAPLNATTVIFGPGHPSACHKPNEYIDFDDVQKAKQYYKNLIVNFLT